MSPLDTKEPVAALQDQVDRRHVRLALGNCTRAGDGTGGLFLPDTLQLAWRNGRVWCVLLSGRKLRLDGHHWIDARRTSRQFVRASGELDAETPQWVHALIAQHQP